MMSSKEGQPKKVRVACNRCRTRRIRCDGRLPACGNCTKAKAPCVDVDGRNTDTWIPRNFASNAKARILWLEGVLCQHVPGFDLSSGPKVDLNCIDAAPDNTEQSLTPESPLPRGAHEPTAVTGCSQNPPDKAVVPEPSQVNGLKRPYCFAPESEKERPTQDDIRSVAIDLGRLSLNTDSRQSHYLGSSSGILFTRLMEAEIQPSTQPGTAPQSDGNTITAYRSTRLYTQARPRKEMYQPLYEKLRKDLPAKEDALFLVQMYFRDIHPEHPIIHPPSLMNALEALYHCAEVPVGTEIMVRGWPEGMRAFAFNGEIMTEPDRTCTPITVYTAIFHVFMVLNLAATMRTRARDVEFAPGQFYRAAMSVSRECFSGISLASLQGVLLLTIHTLLAPAEMNIWTLIHICMAHCVDLGLHREPKPYGQTVAARNIHRLVFHCIYSLDRSIATIQGRPLSIRDETFDVRVPTMEDFTDEISESKATLDHQPSYSGLLPCSLHRFQLDKIISEIKLLFYHLPNRMSALVWPQDLEGCQRRLHHELNVWYSQIASVVQSMELSLHGKDREKWHIKLELLYFAAVVLLFQPSQVFNRPSDEALLLCFKYSARQIEGHNRLHEQDALYPGWRSVQSMFASGATLVSCFWTSKHVQSSAEAASLPKLLRMCSNLLSIGGEWWPSVKQGKISFETVVDITLRRVGEWQSSISSKGHKQPNHTWEHKDVRSLNPIPASIHITGQRSTEAHNPSVGFGPNSSCSMNGFDNFDSFEEQISGFSQNPIAYTEHSSQNMSLSWNAQMQASLGDDLQDEMTDTRTDDSLNELSNTDQDFISRKPNSIDPKIQDFLAHFWAANTEWNESENYAAMTFGSNNSK